MAHAVVLAGNGVPDSLRSPEVTSRALIPFGGKPVLARVLAALRASDAIDQLIVIGPPGLRERVGATVAAHWMDGGDDVPTNLRRSLRGLGLATPVLLVPADLALLSPSLVDLLLRSHPRGVDVAYPLVSVDEWQRAFPSLRPSPVRLRDGVFIGGRAILVKPQAIVMNHGLMQEALARPLTFRRLLRLLGLGTVALQCAGLLTTRRIAARASRLLAAPCLPLFGMPPEIAFTLDSPDHVRVAESHLSQARSAPGMPA